MGNDAILQCNVPSFVADFVTVEGWVDSEGNDFLRQDGVGNASMAFTDSQEAQEATPKILILDLVFYLVVTLV